MHECDMRNFRSHSSCTCKSSDSWRRFNRDFDRKTVVQRVSSQRRSCTLNMDFLPRSVNERYVTDRQSDRQTYRTDNQKTKRSISVGEMYSTICDWRMAVDLGLRLNRSIFLTKICAKNDFYSFVYSDLDLWPLNLKFAPFVILVQRYVSTKLEVSIRLSCFEKIGGTGRTNRQKGCLMRPPIGGSIISLNQHREL